MNRVTPLNEVRNLKKVADDLNWYLRAAANIDIGNEFPETVDRYTGDTWDVQSRLTEAQNSCIPGVRQQFIAFAGREAVGMSVVRVLKDKVPKEVDPNWPNISLFVCNPFRNKGIGKLTISRQVSVVNEDFGGHAWTLVKKENVASHLVVTNAGFTAEAEGRDSILYTYHKS